MNRFGGIGATSKENFAGLGFAPGFVRGYRTWRASDDGLLRGLYYPQAWLPTVNVAYCRKHQFEKHPVTMAGPPLPPARRPDDEYPVPDRGHLAECVCGLHGFYEGSNDYHKPSRRLHNVTTRVTIGSEQPNFVEGMVDGFGEVLIGRRGFKCTKARIVALVFPDTLVAPALILSRYPDVPVFSSFDQMIQSFPTVDGTE